MEETAAHRRTIRPTPDKPCRNVGVRGGGEKRQEGKSNKTENTEKNNKQNRVSHKDIFNTCNQQRNIHS